MKLKCRKCGNIENVDYSTFSKNFIRCKNCNNLLNSQEIISCSVEELKQKMKNMTSNNFRYLEVRNDKGEILIKTRVFQIEGKYIYPLVNPPISLAQFYEHRKIRDKGVVLEGNQISFWYNDEEDLEDIYCAFAVNIEREETAVVSSQSDEK